MRAHKKKKPLPKRPEIRRLTVQVKRGRHHVPYPLSHSIPEFRFGGKWLLDAGFEPGATFTVISQPGLLIIQPGG